MQGKKALVLTVLISLTLILFSGCNRDTICGDGVCSGTETQLNCSEDCGLPTTYHYTCSNEQCIKIEGIGENTCENDIDCKPIYHSECQNEQCIQVEGAGENTCQINEDCITTKTCTSLGGNIINEDTEYTKIGTNLQQKFFYWTVCDGNVIEAIDGNCCLGNVNQTTFTMYSPKPVKEKNPFNIGFNFYYGVTPPNVEYTSINGNKQILDTSKLEHEKGVYIEEISDSGTKTGKVRFIGGSFNGKEAALNIDIIAEQEAEKYCLDSLYPSIDTQVFLKGEKEPMLIKSSGNLQTIFDDYGNSYIVDNWILKEFSTINGRILSPLELQELTLSNEYIVQMKDLPALSSINSNTTAKTNNATIKARLPQIESTQNQVIQKIKKQGAEIKSKYKYSFNGFSIKINKETKKEILLTLKADSRIKNIFGNTQVKAILDESIPMIDANTFWESYNKGNGITIGIIDTGIDYTHQDLGGCFGENCKVKGGYDFVNNDTDPMDDHGHGTHCAGIAASNGQLKGVAPEANLYALKVLDSGGSGYYDAIVNAIEWSIDPNQDGNISDHLDVISLSLGGGGDADNPLSLAIDKAFDAGIISVVAAGNEGYGGYSTIGSPGSSRKAITVGAALNQNIIADFSSKGPSIGNTGYLAKPDVSAPGVDICATEYADVWNDRKCFDDKHVSLSGTSMATPHVAGIVALIKKANPSWNNKEIKSAIITTAKNITNENLQYDIFTQGTGMVNVMSANNAKVSFYPTTLNFESQRTSSINIKNISSKKQKIILPSEILLTNSMSTNNQEITKPIYSKNNFCLEPGQSTDINISFSTQSYGVFGGEIPINIQDNCDGNINTQTILVSQSKSKNIKVTIEPDYNAFENYEETGVYSQSYILIADNNGKYIASKSINKKLEGHNQINFEINVFQDTNKVNLIYKAEYGKTEFDFSSRIFYLGSKEINLDTEKTEIILDERKKQRIETNYDTFFKEKKLVQNFVKYSLTPIISNIDSSQIDNSITSSYVSHNLVCSDWLKSVKINHLTELDGNLEFSLMIGSTTAGQSISDANEIYIYIKELILPNQNEIIFDEKNQKTTNLNINSISKKTNNTRFGYEPYLNSESMLINFSVDVFTKNKKLKYTENSKIGYWLIVLDSIKTTNPILSIKEIVPYVSYLQESFNGKTRAEFNQDWSNIPTGEMINPTEFFKAPIWLENSVTSYNGYLQLQSNLISSYRNSQIKEYFLGNYDFNYIEKYRLGKIKVTTPSGKIIDSNGLNFYLNCNTNYGWPLIPCEDGKYIISVNLKEDIIDSNDSKKYYGIMKNNEWIEYGVVDSNPVCGNSIIEGKEVCDKNSLNNKTCISFGFDGGVLKCNQDCLSFNTSNCTTKPKNCIITEFIPKKVEGRVYYDLYIKIENAKDVNKYGITGLESDAWNKLTFKPINYDKNKNITTLIASQTINQTGINWIMDKAKKAKLINPSNSKEVFCSWETN